MYYGKEVRIFLKGQAKESYLELKNRTDKEARSILKSIERIKETLKNKGTERKPGQKKKIQITLAGHRRNVYKK